MLTIMVKSSEKSKTSLVIDVFLCFKDVFLKFTYTSTISIIRSSYVQKISLQGLLFCQLLANKHNRGTKIPPF